MTIFGHSFVKKMETERSPFKEGRIITKKPHQHRYKLYKTIWHNYGFTSQVEKRYRCVICGKKMINDGVYGFWNAKGKRIHSPMIIDKLRKVV